MARNSSGIHRLCFNTKPTSNPPGVAKQERRTAVAKEYNVSGVWTLSQANGWHAEFDIDQTGTIIRGTAFAEHPSFSGDMNGSGDGSVSEGPGAPGQQFSFTVLWGGSNPIKARYTGTFGFDNRITGVNFAVDNPSVQTTWVSDKAFNKFP
jgi:hypothetical protein